MPRTIVAAVARVTCPSPSLSTIRIISSTSSSVTCGRMATILFAIVILHAVVTRPTDNFIPHPPAQKKGAYKLRFCQQVLIGGSA